jgi:tRNA nucleotidyltransferase/poly(A) polymerase
MKHIFTNYRLFLENQKSDMWTIIPDSVKELHLLFKEHNKKLFVVGGAVRDFINGEPPKDFDLCTDALPNEVLQILADKYRTTQHGEAFGVVVVYTEDQPKGMEIATMREDVYGDKLGTTRNPDVKFSTIDKDVERRDITFNALFYDLDKREIIDLVGGIQDLKNKITRFIGDPALRIKEDPLRIMRFLRFNCRYQFKLDDNSAKAIKENADKLSIISKERIWALSGDNPGEIAKAWKQAKSFTQYLNLFETLDLWKAVLPGFKVNTKIKDSEYLEIYFANLFKDNNTDVLMRRLVLEFKIETEMVRKITALISLLSLNEDNFIDIYKKLKVARIEEEVIKDWLRINELTEKIFTTFLKWKPSVSAQELMRLGFSGPALGAEIKRRETAIFKEMML